MKQKTPEIKLTKENWWTELDSFGLPCELVGDLRSLVSSYLNNTIQPSAGLYEIRLAMEKTFGELWIDDEYFQLMVWTPFNEKTHRTFWYLLKTYPQGELMDYFKNNRSNDYERFGLEKP